MATETPSRGRKVSAPMESASHLDRVQVYSPTQAATGAFLGGPLAAIYFIKANYRALGNSAAEKNVTFYGLLATLALMALLPFLPEKFPSMAIPIATLMVTRKLVKQYQFSKHAI